MLRTTTRKVAALIGGAVVLGVTGWITATTTGLLESGKERLFGGPALGVRVVPPADFFSAHPYAPYYVVPAARVPRPAALPAPAEERLLTGDWQLENGVAGSPQVVRIELRAKSEEPVIVEAIRANIARTSAPVSGWFFLRPACGIQPVRVVSVDLNDTPPAVTYADEMGQLAPTLALRVGRSEPELLELHAATTRGAVDWTAEILFSGPDGADSVEVDDEGRPFRVTTERASKGYRGVVNGSGPVSFERMPTWDDGIEAC